MWRNSEKYLELEENQMKKYFIGEMTFMPFNNGD